MIRLNIHEARLHLSRYLDRLLHGETIVLCRRNEPIAEIRPLTRAQSDPRPFGLAAEIFSVPASFYDPLPEEIIEGFEDRGA